MQPDVSLHCSQQPATLHILRRSTLAYVQYYFLAIYFNIILTSTIGLFPSSFPNKTLYAPLPSTLPPHIPYT